VEPNTLIALAAAGGVFCLGFLLLGSGESKSDIRVKKLSGHQSPTTGFLAKIKAEDGGNRRKQIEETLGKIEERQKTKKKKAKALPAKLIQADWNTKPQTFMIISLVLAVIAGGLPFALGLPPLFCLGLAVGLGFGMPRFILNSAIARRQKKFTNHFAVLRGRKLLREKIKALSAEAKMSAIIIGILPIAVGGLVTVISPDYMLELYTTPTGHRNLMIGAGMMVLGTLMMRKMINFKF